MNLSEARAAVERLSSYNGKAMKPFNAPVRGFVIVPASKEAYDAMFQSMQEKNIPFEEAIKPFEEDVTIIAYFNVEDQKTVQHCSYEYFLSANNLTSPEKH